MSYDAYFDLEKSPFGDTRPRGAGRVPRLTRMTTHNSPTDLCKINLGESRDGKKLANFAVKEILAIEDLRNHFYTLGKYFSGFSLSVRTINDLKRCGYFPPYFHKGIKSNNS